MSIKVLIEIDLPITIVLLRVCEFERNYLHPDVFRSNVSIGKPGVLFSFTMSGTPEETMKLPTHEEGAFYRSVFSIPVIFMIRNDSGR